MQLHGRETKAALHRSQAWERRFYVTGFPRDVKKRQDSGVFMSRVPPVTVGVASALAEEPLRRRYKKTTRQRGARTCGSGGVRAKES
jgi:hypothetical protein